MTVDEHVAVLHAAMQADHEALIAEIREWADAAAARGDLVTQRRHLERIARLGAIPKPWERHAA